MAGTDSAATADRSPGLPDPVVPADAYDEDYYRSRSAGHEEWTATGGRAFRGIYHHVDALLGLEPGQTLVDVGCGRGELVAVAAARGVRAIGIEYSEAAVSIARSTLEVQGVTDLADVLLADARAVPVSDASADAVTLLEVVEHLSPDELDGALRQALRMLRPGGRLFCHTMPNRSIYEITYRAQRLLKPWRLRRWPADPRNEYERLMHVNEQTVTSLRRALGRAGFARVDVALGDWIYTDFVPSRRAQRPYRLLARIGGPMARLGVANIFATAHRPA